MTLPIFICDDDPQILSHYQRIVDNTIMINAYDMQVTMATTDIQDLRDYLHHHPHLTDALFLLDIDLHSEVSGIDVAVEIRHQDDYARIVFLTAHQELAYETLKRRIAALDFIAKGAGDKAQLQSLLAELERNARRNGHSMRQYFTFDVGSREVRVDLEAIYFIESAARPHKVVLYGEAFMYEFYAKLSDIAEAYPALLRVKKSYLINPKQVLSIDFKQRVIQFPESLSCTFPMAMSRQLRQLKL